MVEVTLVIEKTVKEKEFDVVRTIKIHTANLGDASLEWEEALELQQKLAEALRYQNTPKHNGRSVEQFRRATR